MWALQSIEEVYCADGMTGTMLASQDLGQNKGRGVRSRQSNYGYVERKIYILPKKVKVTIEK